MGEMADYILDNSPDELDWFAPERPHQCAYCGKRGLHWVMTDRGWRLATTNRRGEEIIHSCTQYRKIKGKE
jgi:hypothetical protein